MGKIPEVWTKEQYQQWLATRGECGTWTFDDCRNADMHIKHVALGNFHHWSQFNIKNKHAREFIRRMVRCQYGAAEVDDLLNKLQCYPSWMEDAA